MRLSSFGQKAFGRREPSKFLPTIFLSSGKMRLASRKACTMLKYERGVTSRVILYFDNISAYLFKIELLMRHYAFRALGLLVLVGGWLLQLLLTFAALCVPNYVSID